MSSSSFQQAHTTLARKLRLQFNPSTTAVLVIDMQNDFCAPDGFYVRHGSDVSAFNAITGNVSSLIKRARAAGAEVAFARLNYSLPRGSMDQRHNLMPRGWPSLGKRLQSGTRGVEVIDELEPHADDIIVDKSGYSAFEGTALAEKLRAKSVKTVVLTGLVAYACVLATAFSAFDKDFDVVFVEDAVASWGGRLQDETCQIVDLLLGAVVSASDVQFGGS